MIGARPRRLAAVLTGCIALLGASSATALAASPPSAPAAKVELLLQGAFTVNGQPVSVPGRSVTVRGIVRPYVAGEHVQLTETLGRRVLAHQILPIRRSPGGTYGWFSQAVSSPSAGRLTIAATHLADAGLGTFLAATSYAALDDQVGFGATGRFVELLQQRLAALHLYIPQTGVYDTGTGLAIDAYHRLLRWGTSQTLDHQTIVWLLNGWGSFHVRYPADGKHVEGNLSLQLLALINHGQVLAIYPISSGKPSTPTILGRFHVYEKTPGYLPDGMYYSSFFSGGYAVHGYDPAPDYPASHGCMRVPIVDAISIYNWVAIGDGVDVYY